MRLVNFSPSAPSPADRQWSQEGCEEWAEDDGAPVLGVDATPIDVLAQDAAAAENAVDKGGDLPLATAGAPAVTRLGLADFRNYGALNAHFGPRVNILLGDNGSGKTNILEAVSLLGRGRGLRQAPFADMTKRDGAGQWSIAADFQMASGAARIRMSHGGAGRQITLDGADLRGIDHLTQMLPQLWLTPAMDRLFVEAASGRRRFLDRLTVTLLPAASRANQAFEKAMRERNRILSEPSWANHRAWLDGLEDTMALNAATIAAGRLYAIDSLAAAVERLPEGDFPRAHLGLEGGLETALRSMAAADVEDQYRAQLVDMRARDAAAGRALEGPHRSDFLVVHAAKNMPASECSTGEQKALLVGLILAQADTVIARTGDIPVLLLDEVTAHLDERRRAALADILVALGGQVWITGTDRGNFTAFDEASDYFNIVDGRVTPTQ